MVQKVQIVVTDDLDGTPAGHTIEFGLDDVSYEIDLNDEHAEELRAAFALYVKHGRRVAKTQRPHRAGRGTVRRTSRTDAAKMRAWATEQGMTVPPRGRIPANIREAYEAGGHAATSAPADVTPDPLFQSA